MARVKGGTVARKRRRKILKLAKGYFGSKHVLYKTANEQVMKSLVYAYRDRKNRKRNFRKLWITRINAAARLNGMSYSKFVNGLNLAGVQINRKMLADIAVHDAEGFAKIVKVAKTGVIINDTFAPKKAVPKKVEKVVAKPVKEVVEETVKEPVKKVVKAPVKKAVKAPAKKGVKAPAKKVVKAPAKKVVKAETDLSTKTVAELKAIAKGKGIKGYTSLKKAELLDILK